MSSNSIRFDKETASGNAQVDMYRAILNGICGSTFDERQRKLAKVRAVMSLPKPNKVHPPAIGGDWKPDEIEDTTIFNY